MHMRPQDSALEDVRPGTSCATGRPLFLAFYRKATQLRTYQKRRSHDVFS